MKINYTIKLGVVCILAFTIQTCCPVFTEFFSLSSLLRPWTLLTYIFLHGSLEHLIFNMFYLLLFGSILENIIGGKKFLIVFFVSGIAAGLAALIFYKSTVGASGAIFGILGCLAIMRPKMVVWIYNIPMPMIAAALVYGVVNYVESFFPSNVAYFSHIAGLAAGIVFGILFYMPEKKTSKKKPLREEEILWWEEKYMKRSP